MYNFAMYLAGIRFICVPSGIVIWQAILGFSDLHRKEQLLIQLNEPQLSFSDDRPT